MISVLLEMSAFIVFGVLVRQLRPGNIDGVVLRQSMTSIVYYLFLPGLVLLVLWRTPLGTDSLRIIAVAVSGVLSGMLLAWGSCRVCGLDRPLMGAILLASAFPNATYLGLPILEASFGTWARGVAIQYDLFACLPLVLTLGVAVAKSHGSTPGSRQGALAIWRVPPLWAAGVAIVFNRTGVPLGGSVEVILEMMAGAVVPLMLVSLGLSLQWRNLRKAMLGALMVVSAIQLIIMPLVAWGVGGLVGLDGRVLGAVVLEAAMPSMVLGIVLCDRFGLDTALYASAVTVSTILSLLALPLWFDLVA